MSVRLEMVIRAQMHLHLLQRVRVIFLRTPITIYNYVFQENSQYSSCCEQRLQAISNKWSNPPVFWGIFALARSADSWCKVQGTLAGTGGRAGFYHASGAQDIAWTWTGLKCWSMVWPSQPCFFHPPCFCSLQHTLAIQCTRFCLLPPLPNRQW